MAVFTAALFASTAIGGTFLATAAAAALNLALGIGVELAITSLMPKPEQPKFSIQGKLQAGEDTPRTVPVGYTATAGSLVYGNTWGKVRETKNAYFTQVIALADIPISGLAGIWVGEQKVTLPDMSGAAPVDQGYPIEEFRSKSGSDYLWVKFYDGTQTTADSFLASTVSSSDRPYETTRVGKGVAYVIMTARINESLFTGLPSFRFELNGAKLYDITKDGSAGGTGLQRWADPSTWGGDGDLLPAVQMYNILRGITYGSQWLYGAQNMPEARLPRADWIAAINKCRATVANGTGTEPSYRSGAEIRVSTSGLDSIKLLQDACLGHLAEVGGVYTLHVGEPADSSFSITDDDIISTEEQIFTPFFGLADCVNGITAKYPSPADGWNSKTAPPLFSADFEAEDGNRRLISDLSLDAVPYDAQVQRIMKAALAEARRSRRHTMVLPPKFWRYAVPNVVFSYTSTRNGYTTKLFRIDGAGDKANLDNTINVTEVDPSDFDWTHSTDFTPVTEGNLGSPTIPAQMITGWNAAPVIVKDAAGSDRRPGILVTFDGGLDDVQSVRVQVRLSGATTLQFDGTVPYGDLTTDGSTKSVTISFASILPATAYEVRGILVPYSGREALWSNETIASGEIVEGAWLGVTTDDVRFGRKDLYDGIIDVGALADDLKDLQQNFASSIRALSEQIAQVALGDADGQFGAYQDVQASYQKVIAQTGTLSAAVEQAIAAATGPDSALATAITALNASDTAGNVADATFQISTSYTPATGWDSKIGMQVRTGHTGTFADAGFFMEAKDDGTTRILMDADSIVMVNGAYAAQPFVFTAGVLTLQAANIGTVTAGTLKSPDELFVITLDEGKLEWFETV